MGGGYWRREDFTAYSRIRGRTVRRDGHIDTSKMRGAQDMYQARQLDPQLNPYKVNRECCDSREHPETVPVILALDVTGSMGGACLKTAASLNVIMQNILDEYRDVEFMVMGIGDLAYDKAPIQISQFESDIRIAEQLDKIWFERGGGGNSFESYTAAWYMGLYHTSLDCWKRGKKGIIITMGDEPLNPYLPYKTGQTTDVDLLIGTNSEEMNYWIGEIGGVVPFRFSIPVKFENDMKTLPESDRERVKSFMNGMRGHSMWKMARFYDEMMFRLPAVEQAQSHSDNGGRTYMYYWTVPSTLPLRKACHAVELSYVFGNLQETIYTGEVADETLSDTVIQLWSSFARTGVPEADGLSWEQYDSENRATMVISREPHIEYDVLSDRRRLLMPLLSHMINPSYATLDYNVPFVRKTVAGAIALALGAAGLTLLAIYAYKKSKKK